MIRIRAKRTSNTLTRFRKMSAGSDLTGMKCITLRIISSNYTKMPKFLLIFPLALRRTSGERTGLLLSKPSQPPALIDQSVLSLLAVKHGLPIFRNPSPHGNRFKLPEFRTPGELLKGSYADKPFANSPYGTLIAGQMHSGKPHPFYRLVRRIFRLLGQNV